MKVYCVFLLESPHRGDSNENTQYTISQYKKENHPKLSQICNYGICSKGPKNGFETAVVNKPSVFKPLKFYCITSLLENFYPTCSYYSRMDSELQSASSQAQLPSLNN